MVPGLVSQHNLNIWHLCFVWKYFIELSPVSILDGCSNICSLGQFYKKYLSFDLILLQIRLDNTNQSTSSNKVHARINILKLILIAYPSFSQDSFSWDLSDVFWLSHSLPLGNWSRESKQIIFNLPRPWATPHFLHISDTSFVAKIPEVKIVNSLRSDPSAVLI